MLGEPHDDRTLPEPDARASAGGRARDEDGSPPPPREEAAALANGVPLYSEPRRPERERSRDDPAGEAGEIERELAEFLPIAYFETDTFGAIRWANHAALEIAGRALYQIEGRPLVTLLPVDQRVQFRRTLAMIVRTGRQERWRTLLRSRDGDVPVELTVGIRRARGSADRVRWLVQREASSDLSAGRMESPPDERTAIARTAVARSAQGLPAGAVWMLSQVGSVLASSFDYLLTVRSALELALPWLGDWAILDLLSESAGIQRAAVARVPMEDREVATMLWRRPPSLGDASDPIARVLCGGGAELIEDVTDGMREQLVSTSWGRELVQRLAPRAWITVPLRARGHTIGAVTFLTGRSRRTFGKGHLLLAQQFADRAALAADNARLYDEATRANEAKSSFLAVMSHELRTPLTAIIGYTELLADGLFGAVSEQQLVQLGRVRESSEHLLRIVEEVLHYARLEARQEHVELEDLDLAALIDQVLTLVRPLAERKGLALTVDQPTRGVRFRSDPGRLRQVLVNLLANAIKFTPAGEVTLVAGERGELIVFEVRDTGPGIHPSQLERIFEPFWQADQRFTRPQPGSGLGLSVTKELISLLGGGIDVRSTVGVGSTFTVWVPRSTPARETDAQDDPSDDTAPRGADAE